MGATDYPSIIFSCGLEYCAPYIYSVKSIFTDFCKVLAKHCFIQDWLHIPLRSNSRFAYKLSNSTNVLKWEAGIGAICYEQDCFPIILLMNSSQVPISFF